MLFTLIIGANFYKNKVYAVKGGVFLVDENLNVLKRFKHDRVLVSKSDNFSKFGVRITFIREVELLMVKKLYESATEFLILTIWFIKSGHYSYFGNDINYYNYRGENVGSKNPEKNTLMKIHKNY
ncbi:hypothetical protein OEA66_15820 [Chryseobacterium sp. KC 927]|uniref:Uncharacterized protein n=2 Tax=Chryseobacterium luquanense TaxID=2983766 RepID=A0ABT3Y6R4_9FLAO|nr:hypothetical protein [Chryseobacterium luquanense]